VSGTTIRVVVADDKQITRSGLRDLINSRPGDGIEVVGEAATGVEALEQCARLKPDVVIMDLLMPEMGGIEATRRLREAHPEVAVLVFSAKGEDHWVLEAMRAGAHGYLLKDADEDDIRHDIEKVAGGSVVFGPSFANRVASWFEPGRSNVRHTFPRLTDREFEVWEGIAEGLDNPAIARELHVSDKWVRNCASQLYAKLGVAGRAGAISAGVEAGLGRTPGVDR
jgi:DNA-binding NarL/FixJ family response regulator